MPFILPANTLSAGGYNVANSLRFNVGSSDYLELLRSEFQLQNLLLQKIEIESKIKENKVLYIFESGLDIY